MTLRAVDADEAKVLIKDHHVEINDDFDEGCRRTKRNHRNLALSEKDIYMASSSRPWAT